MDFVYANGGTMATVLPIDYVSKCIGAAEDGTINRNGFKALIRARIEHCVVIAAKNGIFFSSHPVIFR